MMKIIEYSLLALPRLNKFIWMIKKSIELVANLDHVMTQEHYS